MNKRERELLIKGLRDEKVVLKELQRNYGQALNDVNQNIINLMADELTQSKIYQIGYQEQLKKQLEGVVNTLNAGNLASVEKYLETCYENGFVGTMYNFHGQGIPLVLPIDQASIARMIATTGDNIKLSEKLWGNSTQLKNRVRAEISRGLATGDSYANISRNLKNVAKMDYNKAARIVRTEGHRVTETSSFQAAKRSQEAGADVVKEWNASLDSRTRKAHVELNGEIRELDEPFEVGTMQAMYPSDFGVASMDVNCRCAILQRARWGLSDDELARLGSPIEANDFGEFKEEYTKSSPNIPTKPKFEFKEAKTVKEAEKYARESIGIDHVSYKGLDLTTSNELNRSVARTLNDFPELKDNLGFIGSAQERNVLMKKAATKDIFDRVRSNPNNSTFSDEALMKYAKSTASKLVGRLDTNTMAQSWSPKTESLKPYRGISVNKKFGGDTASFIDTLKRNVASKHFPEGCDTISAIIDHELGHQLDDLLEITSSAEFKAIHGAFKTPHGITEAVSRYATTDSGEFLAECWSEYRNNPKPRKTAKAVGDLIIDKYKGRFGK